MNNKTDFYGPVTVGTKGQIVIPAEAREKLGITAGSKLVVFGLHDGKMLGVCPTESVESLLGELTKKLNTMRKVLDKAKGGK